MNINMNKYNGLKKLPHDRRDLKLGAIVKLPELSELPDEFILPDGLPVKDQSISPAGQDLCSAYASCSISEFQEGVELLPEWSFAASKEISGDVNGFGQDMRTAMKVHQKYGAIEKGEAVIPNNPRYFANWDKSLIEKAKKHKKSAYVNVLGQYDEFDDVRASIWYFRNEKRAVSLGMVWSWNLADMYLNIPSDIGFGHMISAIGWKKINDVIYLIIKNSYNKQAGENGFHYVSREVINLFAKRYGAMMFIDENPEKLKEQQWGIMAKITDIMVRILRLMSEQIKLIEKKKEEEKIIESISDELPPVEPVMEQPWEDNQAIYELEERNPIETQEAERKKFEAQWGTYENIIISIKKIAVEEGVDEELACRVAKCESGLDLKAKRINNDKHKSIDRGLFQWNSYWHPEITDEMAYNPEIACRKFCNAVKNGKLNWWSASKKCWNKGR